MCVHPAIIWHNKVTSRSDTESGLDCFSQIAFMYIISNSQVLFPLKLWCGQSSQNLETPQSSVETEASGLQLLFLPDYSGKGGLIHNSLQSFSLSWLFNAAMLIFILTAFCLYTHISRLHIILKLCHYFKQSRSQHTHICGQTQLGASTSYLSVFQSRLLAFGPASC